MRKLISKLLALLPLLAAVAAVNYLVDPSQLFGNGRVEREMSAIMLRGENVANIVNFDDRLLHKFNIDGMPGAPSIFVLGSSRAMLIRSSNFPGQTLYNSGVAGASVEDYVAISELLAERELLPEVMLVEISPWVFNKNSGQTRWKSLGSAYLAGRERIGLPTSFIDQLTTFDLEKYTALFSLAYLQESIRWASIAPQFYATTSSETGEPMKLSDGSRVYDQESKEQSPNDVRQRALTTVVEPYSLTGYNEIEASIEAEFEQLVSWLQSHEVKIIFVLMPYHPDYYQALIDSNFGIVKDVEETLRDFADDRQIQIIGSYDPGTANCDGAEFYDGLHARENCVNRVLSQIQN